MTIYIDRELEIVLLPAGLPHWIIGRIPPRSEPNHFFLPEAGSGPPPGGRIPPRRPR